MSYTLRVEALAFVPYEPRWLNQCIESRPHSCTQITVSVTVWMDVAWGQNKRPAILQGTFRLNCREQPEHETYFRYQVNNIYTYYPQGLNSLESRTPHGSVTSDGTDINIHMIMICCSLKALSWVGVPNRFTPYCSSQRDGWLKTKATKPPSLSIINISDLLYRPHREQVWSGFTTPLTKAIKHIGIILI